MKEKPKWAFILDKDEFVRLSLNKILKKYGFHVEEIEDFSQLGRAPASAMLPRGTWTSAATRCRALVGLASTTWQV